LDRVAPDACADLLLSTMPNLMRTIGGIARQRRPEGDEAVNPGQIHLLHLLARKPRSLRELAVTHHVTPSTMSRMVDLLVGRGWVARQADPEDRRQVVLSLTPIGQAKLAEAEALLREAVAGLLGQLDAEERGRLYDGLRALGSLLARLEREHEASCPAHGPIARPSTVGGGR
jgi:DNA-binding MarR family transcriptional regulator